MTRAALARQTLQTVILSEIEWTPQNGFLTAAQKLQRKTILQHFQDDIRVRSPRSLSHLVDAGTNKLIVWISSLRRRYTREGSGAAF